MADVELVVADGLAVVTLNAPARRNALTPAMAQDLIDCAETIDADQTIGAAVITGANGQFCAGGERATLDRVGEDPTEASRYDDLGIVYEAFMRFGRVAVPTIAAVNGAAVGAGVNLLLATDLRIVGTSARIIAGFLQIGLHPGGGHFVLMGRTAGREAAAAAGLFGEEISGPRAAELGLAWRCVPDDEVLPTARELGLRAAKDPQLSRLTVESMRLELGPPAVSWEAAMHAERAKQMWSLRRR
jgi:enoyl-CoA hydratase